MEYYAYCELRDFAKDDWTVIDEKYEKQCKFLYSKYERLHEEETLTKRQNSKSAKVEKKLEDIKNKPDYSDTILLKKLKKK